MAQLQNVFAFVVFINALCVFGEGFGHGVCTVVGDSANLSAGQPCTDGQLKLSHRRLKDDSNKPVGAFEKAVLELEEDYRDRVNPISTTSVVLNNVNYNDAGVYEFTCGGSMDVIQLDVVALSEVLVTEGDEGKLPYYFLTAGEVNVRIIHWEKNGELVCKMDLSSRKVTYGTKFNGKVSVSPDWFKQGDLSLNLKRAEPQDEGVFFINHEDKVKMEKAAAVKVRVQKRKSGCPPQSATGEKAMGTSGTVCITASVTLLLVALAAGFAWWMKSQKTSGRRDARPSQDVEMDNSSESQAPVLG